LTDDFDSRDGKEGIVGIFMIQQIKQYGKVQAILSQGTILGIHGSYY
jgi:hypothetical protein